VSSTPFSSLPLSSESLTILPHLEELTKRGWWTVCSQPAVDGALSTDEVFGWGPRGGYVFQKGFVEFFVEEQVLERIEKKVAAEGRGWVHYFSGNLQVSMAYNIAPFLQSHAAIGRM
jgi:methylenetetrahydrofolate reductase (NADPH)